jgi:hypothetical protein
MDHGWLVNVEARTIAGTDQVSAAWEWSMNSLFTLNDHDARMSVFTITGGALRRRLTRLLATPEVAEEPDIYQLSATGRVGPLAPRSRYSDPLEPGTRDGGASGDIVIDQGTWGVDVGSDMDSIPEPGPWDDLFPPGRVDVFYFEVVGARGTLDVTARLFHEAFTLDGARLPTAAVVVPHA